LDSTPTAEEIRAIINNMRSYAAPGPDGFNAAFYRAAWKLIGNDVVSCNISL
jgi:hypothetical protein